jgi:endonuclease YncB( thermonuclease family)
MVPSRLRRALATGICAGLISLADATPSATITDCRTATVTDGDTLVLRCTASTYTVRLMEIDAPETAQAFGRRATRSLRALCTNVTVELAVAGHDRYGRTLARVRCRGRDASLHQVTTGHAWAFTRYLTDPTIAAAEHAARQARRGLWHTSNPEPPWEYRRRVK